MSGLTDEERKARLAAAAVNGRPNDQGSKLLRLLSIADLADLPEPSWLVDHLLPARSFSVLYGPSGSGKTFVALGLALSIASETPWLTVRDITAGPVVYIAAEGAGGLKRRVDAWCTDQGVQPRQPSTSCPTPSTSSTRPLSTTRGRPSKHSPLRTGPRSSSSTRWRDASSAAMKTARATSDSHPQRRPAPRHV